MTRPTYILDDAIRLCHEVRYVSGKQHWDMTRETLRGHYNAPGFDVTRARELIRRHVRNAKQWAAPSADVPAIELATDALLVETVADFLRTKLECQHPRKQRQCDEYYCPACGKRWEASDSDDDQE